MTISDFLILISIGVAVITMCEANNKKIWRYKFSVLSSLFVFSLLLWILYLIKYPSFRAIGWYLPFFECEIGFSCGTWAFIISIVLLVYVAYKIAFQKHFPKSQHNSLISYYHGLIYSDFDLLLSYLEYYHNPNSICHLAKAIILLKRKKNTNKSLENRIRREIVYDYYFIEKIVSTSPSLFLEHTTSLYSTQDDETITANEYYAKCLTKEFNYRFYDAIENAYKKCNEDKDCKMTDVVKQNPLLRNLFQDKDYYTHIQLIHIFRDEAKKEISSQNPTFDREYVLGGFQDYYHSVFYQYLMLYTITLEHIFDTLHNSKGKAHKSTLECVGSIYGLNPSLIYSYTDKKETITTFRDGLSEEIECMVLKLVYYCEKHNYTDRMKYALMIWLQIFHVGIEIGTTREDRERLESLITDENDKWPNCHSAICNLIEEINNKQNK